jgi:hypothetical protein
VIRYKLIITIFIKYYLNKLVSNDKDSLEIIIYKLKKDPEYTLTKTEKDWLEFIWMSKQYDGIGGNLRNRLAVYLTKEEINGRDGEEGKQLVHD